MLHHRPRFAGLLVIIAALLLAPSAVAAAPAARAAGPSPAKAKERLYGKHCGAKRTGSGRPAQRAKCLEAMAKLATGRSSSPRAACRALSRKKVRGARRSAFARCVSAGARLLRSKGRDNRDSVAGDEGVEPDDRAADGDDSAGDPDDPDGELDDPAAGDAPADADLDPVEPDDDPGV